MKTKLKLNQLIDADATYVSLVERGANRCPFKMLKSQEKNDMFDLSKMFKSEPKTPVVGAVVVSAKYNKEDADKLVGAAGFSIEKCESSDEGHIYVQGENTGNHVFMKLDDDIYVAVENLKKTFNSWSTSSTFTEVMQTEGFFPSFHVAKDALCTTMYNIMYQAEDMSEAGQKLSQAVDEFKGYVMSILTAIPQEVFKAEDKLMIAKSDLSKATVEEPIVEEPKPEDSEAPVADTETPDEQITETVSGGEDTVPAGTTDDTVAGDTQSDEIESEPTDEIQKTLSTIQESFEGLKKSVDSVAELANNVSELRNTISEFTERLAKAESISAKAYSAVTGTVVLSEQGNGVRKVEQKAEGTGVPPLMDTGYSSRLVN